VKVLLHDEGILYIYMRIIPLSFTIFMLHGSIVPGIFSAGMKVSGEELKGNHRIPSGDLHDFTIQIEHEMNLISIPIIPGRTSIGNVIGNQLKGNTSELNADRVWKWNSASKSYQIAWLVEGGANDGKWWDTSTQRESKITLDAGQGFWIQNRSGAKEITFAGKVFDKLEQEILLEKGLQIIGFTFPQVIPLSRSNLWQEGAVGDVNELDSDRVWEWDATIQKYRIAWLIDGVGPTHNGLWWDSSKGKESAILLKPGVGYWIEIRDLPGRKSFTWTYQILIPQITK
jgi:hypothetical protein